MQAFGLLSTELSSLSAVPCPTKVLVDLDTSFPDRCHGDGATIAQAKREYAVFASREHPPDLCGDVTWAGL